MARVAGTGVLMPGGTPDTAPGTNPPPNASQRIKAFDGKGLINNGTLTAIGWMVAIPTVIILAGTRIGPFIALTLGAALLYVLLHKPKGSTN